LTPIHVENNRLIQLVQDLAAALHVNMTNFFDNHAPTQILHVKAKHRPVISSNGVRIEGLDGKLNYQEMEPFLITLDPIPEVVSVRLCIQVTKWVIAFQAMWNTQLIERFILWRREIYCFSKRIYPTYGGM